MVSRLFLRKLRDTLQIPVLALVDSDPYGLKILSVYMKGELCLYLYCTAGHCTSICQNQCACMQIRIAVLTGANLHRLLSAESVPTCCCAGHRTGCMLQAA